VTNGTAIVPRVSAYWQHAIGNLTPSTALTFLGTGVGFSVTGVPLGSDTAVVESGFDLQLNPQARIGVSYFGQLAPYLSDHAVKGKFTWNF
jgi:outer membrane autotransporter protein